MSKKLVYLETSFVSYLVARPSRDIIVAAHQSITHQWWSNRSPEFELVISEVVLEEARRGNVEAAENRLNVLTSIPLVEVSTQSVDFANNLIEAGVVPKKAVQDALHIAICCANRVDYLLTWNCKHIANAEKRKRISAMAEQNGFLPTVICTPEELLGDQDER